MNNSIATTTQPSDNSEMYSKIQDPISAIEKMGEWIAASGMLGCTKVEQGKLIAWQCAAEKKTPFDFKREYHIIAGSLSMRSDAMLGRFLSAGGKVKWITRNNDEVKALWSHEGSEIEIGVTVEEMKANGVALSGKGGLKDNWRKFPRQMLTARCISEGVRLLAPQIVSGVYTPEEVQDFNSTAPAARQIASAPEPIIARPPVVEVSDPKKEVIGRLTELLDKYEPNATKYLLDKGYLRAGQTYHDLDAMTAQRVLSNPTKIIGILEGLA